MATYKAVMMLTLEYTSSTWLRLHPELASESHAERSFYGYRRIHTRHKLTTSAWRNTHTSHTQAPAAPRLTIQTENTTSITPPTQTYNILHHSKAETLSLIMPTTQQTFTQTSYSHNNRHKSKHVPYTHIYCLYRYLATRVNNKILRTLPTHISYPKKYFTTSLIAPLSHPEQSRCQFTAINIMPLCNHIISSTGSTYAPHCHPWIYGQTPLEWHTTG